jgi:hypothetical protein
MTEERLTEIEVELTKAHDGWETVDGGSYIHEQASGVIEELVAEIRHLTAALESAKQAEIECQEKMERCLCLERHDASEIPQGPGIIIVHTQTSIVPMFPEGKDFSREWWKSIKAWYGPIELPEEE